MSKKDKKIPFAEQVMWYCLNIGAFFTIVGAVPVIPWRYSKVDTNVGNRFVMERYYTLTGCSNNLGKSQGWFTLRKKLQRKTEEFGRPSPITAILGTVTQGMGTGGAAVGCAMWQKCKDHVNSRFMEYTTVAYTGLTSIIFMILGSILSIASGVFLGFEQASSGKKKKKKGDECMEPVSKTMTLAVFGFMFSSGGVAAFVVVLGGTLKTFQETAYYPFAGSHVGPFMSGFGSFLIFIGMCIATNRSFQCCGKKKEDDHGEGEAMAYGAPGAYGPYGAQPGYGPPQGQW